MSVLARNNVVVRGPADAPPMLFAHGFGCDQQMWRHVAPAFEDRYRTILFDHVGAGGSDLSAYRFDRYGSLTAYAEDVLEICSELDLRDVVFVGHSVSAMIGVLAANLDPARFAALVLVAPSPRYTDEDGYVGGFAPQDIEALLDALEDNYLGWSTQMAPVIVGNPERPELGAELTSSFCRTDPEIAAQFARVTFLGDNRADLERVRIPALVLQCSDDPIAPMAVGEFVHRSIPQSDLVVVQDNGHCPNLSAPEATIEAMEHFLAGRVPLVA